MTAILIAGAIVVAYIAFVALIMLAAHRLELRSHAFVFPADGSFGRVLVDGEALKHHGAAQYSTKVEAAPVIENRNFGR